MRLVVAVLRPALVESVRQALAAIEVTRMTIGDAHGYDLADPGAVVQETLLEIAVNDDFLGRTVEAVAEVIAAGRDPEAGRVFVLPMTEAVQIYRDVRGQEAI
jgi:nitrogen regulatory protein P-II 2